MVDIMSYQQQSLETISKYTTFSGKKILEIGGDLGRKVANKLIELGAGDVWSINSDEKYCDQDAINMHARKLSALEINRYFGTKAFDIVFGIAVLEHIDDIKTLSDSIKAVVRPGGIVYLQGGPFWTCCHGHHLVCFVDGQLYAFNGNNPVPDWLHLLQSGSEAAETLKRGGVPCAHVEAIVKQIYHNSHINRRKYSEIKQILLHNDLNVYYIEEHIRKKPDELVLTRLADLGWSLLEPFGVYSADFVFLP